MLKGYVVSNSLVWCPLCMRPDFATIRKVPGSDHAIVIQCRCEACGEFFEYEEDAEGHIILPGTIRSVPDGERLGPEMVEGPQRESA